MVIVYKTLLDVKGITTGSSNSNPPEDFDTFLESHLQVDQNDESILPSDVEIYKKIDAISSQERVLATEKKFDIFAYILNKYADDKILQETCLAVMCTPSTSVSVESTFSSLHKALSRERSSLSSGSVRDLMFVNQNYDILDELDFSKIMQTDE